MLVRSGSDWEEEGSRGGGGEMAIDMEGDDGEGGEAEAVMRVRLGNSFRLMLSSVVVDTIVRCRGRK